MLLVSTSEISRLQLASIAEQTCLSVTLSHTSEDRLSHDMAIKHQLQREITNSYQTYCKKKQKNSDTWKIAVIILKFEQYRFKTE